MKMKKIVLTLCVVAVVAICGVTVFSLNAKENENVIPDGITIGGTDVSGMTAEEAQQVVDDYMQQYKNATFTLKAGSKKVTATSKDLGLCVKNDDVVEQALTYGRKGNLIYRYKAKLDLKHGKGKNFDVIPTTTTSDVKAFLKKHKSELIQEVVNNTVKLVDGEFEYVEGKTGEELLTGKSAVAIADYVSSEWTGSDATIELLTKKEEPKGSKEELSTIKDVLGAYHTNFGTAVDGRTKNINVASGLMDGMIVYPGEVVSVAESIGPTTEENGYFPAGSYENGTTVETYGGGVCQVSSTLYNAVLLAELEVVQRYNHSMIVGYVQPSMDAAIADGSKDFQFKNNLDTPIYIESYTSGGNLYFTIYGKETRPANRKVEYVSEVTSQTEPEKEFVPAPDQPIGYVETTVKPHIGYTARLWKVVTENGAEVSREQINSSKYAPSKEVIAIGVATADPNAYNTIMGAIGSQNADIVYSTIPSCTDAALAANAQAQAQAAEEQQAAENKQEEASHENKKTEDDAKEKTEESDGE